MRAAKPTASWFHDHVVVALGRLSQAKPFVGFKPGRVIGLAIELAGIDPENSPWPIHAPKHQGLDRKVQHAFRNQRPDTNGSAYAGTRAPLCALMPDGAWALMVAGVERYKELLGSPLPQISEYLAGNNKKKRKPKKVIDLQGHRNLTAKWIHEQGAPLRDDLVKYISLKMPKSRDFEQIEDHVNEHLTLMVHRDALRDRILDGVEITFAHIRGYCHNTAKSDIRNNSRNPVCRTFHGAYTAKERAEFRDRQVAREKAEEDGEFSVPVRVRQTVQPWQRGPHFDHEEESWVHPLEEMPDPAGIQEVEDEMAFEQAFKALRAVLQKRCPGSAEQYTQVLYDRIVMEMTVKEIATKIGVTRNQAASMLRTAKSIIKREVAAGRGGLREILGR